MWGAFAIALRQPVFVTMHLSAQLPAVNNRQLVKVETTTNNFMQTSSHLWHNSNAHKLLFYRFATSIKLYIVHALQSAELCWCVSCPCTASNKQSVLIVSNRRSTHKQISSRCFFVEMAGLVKCGR